MATARKTTSPGSPSDTNQPGIPERRRSFNVLAGTIGHFVEWYDWYIYGLLAAVFADQIFPSGSALTSLFAALITYAIGFVVRPMSGIIISPLADRYGRRAVLAVTIGGMAAGSLIIALTPPFAVIGYAAPLLFLFARVLQGISAGSEIQSAIAYMVENGSTNRRGLFGSLSNVASGMATLAATGAAAIVTSTLDSDDLATWGWRIPFAIGGVLGLVGLLLRSRADESPEFEEAAQDSGSGRRPARSRLRVLLRDHRKALLQTAALSAPAVAYYTWATFLPTYAQLTTGRDLGSTLTGNVIGLCLLVIIVPACGALSDRLGRRKPFPIIGAAGMVVLFYPLLLLLQQPGFGVYVIVTASGWVVLAIWQAVYPTIQADLFPASVRVSGIGVAHQLVIAAFGGTAPLIASAFVDAGHPMGVAVYMTIVVLLCLIVYVTLPETGTAAKRPTAAPAEASNASDATADSDTTTSTEKETR
ncbi:MHS family alpha-ketoglutarate permease-like MFS transporter [Prauserella sediminis]|uniref:MHS family alpha-ketoglutarate permease-like MFS transporter n=1 Tax=Prauserella sediminis TaxID=577680 RepID=A0A839XU85_9PSEU|nr:MFS transporter [Prauserella sediminis]MBB3664598.1 MHS family alpha-ketoglutarate permease-like MFS transporter [Prauserella sediminis]